MEGENMPSLQHQEQNQFIEHFQYALGVLGVHQVVWHLLISHTNEALHNMKWKL